MQNYKVSFAGASSKLIESTSRVIQADSEQNAVDLVLKKSAGSEDYTGIWVKNSS
jgi:hypothetical protein